MFSCKKGRFAHPLVPTQPCLTFTAGVARDTALRERSDMNKSESQSETFVNLTSHTITIYDIINHRERPVLVLHPSGIEARVQMGYKLRRYISPVPVYSFEAGETVGLPDPKPGVYYIVSSLVQAAVPDRDDLLAPGELIKDQDGHPIGCLGLKAR